MLECNLGLPQQEEVNALLANEQKIAWEATKSWFTGCHHQQGEHRPLSPSHEERKPCTSFKLVKATFKSLHYPKKL